MSHFEHPSPQAVANIIAPTQYVTNRIHENHVLLQQCWKLAHKNKARKKWPLIASNEKDISQKDIKSRIFTETSMIPHMLSAHLLQHGFCVTLCILRLLWWTKQQIRTYCNKTCQSPACRCRIHLRTVVPSSLRYHCSTCSVLSLVNMLQINTNTKSTVCRHEYCRLHHKRSQQLHCVV